MYDSVVLSLYNSNCPNTDFISQTPQFLSNIINYGNNQYGNYVIGYLDNLKVMITGNKVAIIEGSLCKYHLGDNFKTLTRGDTKKAIQNISDTLHLPFDLAEVKKIHFSQNFIMQKHEKAYLQCLGNLQYYNRLEASNGLYYTNSLRQLLFYGKEYEQRVKKQPIPDLYKDKNVLRYEMSLQTRLKQQLNMPEVTANNLSDEAFYHNLVKRWKNEYLAIQKINLKISTMKPTGSTKEFFENLALWKLSEFTQAQMLDLIKQWQLSKEITKKQARDLREKIRESYSIVSNESTPDLIEELDKKIKEAARY